MAGGNGAGRGVATWGAGGIGAGFGGLVAQAGSKMTPISRLARNQVTGEDGLRQQMIMSEVMDAGLKWILIEAGVALGLLLFIVWWTAKK